MLNGYPFCYVESLLGILRVGEHPGNGNSPDLIEQRYLAPHRFQYAKPQPGSRVFVYKTKKNDNESFPGKSAEYLHFTFLI